MTGPKPKAVKPIDVRPIPENVWDLLDSLACDGLYREYHTPSDETFTMCKVCQEWEDHHPDCPMPQILKLMETEPKDNKEKP